MKLLGTLALAFALLLLGLELRLAVCRVRLAALERKKRALLKRKQFETNSMQHRDGAHQSGGR